MADLHRLRADGCTLLVTVLGDGENARSTIQAAKSLSMEVLHVNIKMPGLLNPSDTDGLSKEKKQSVRTTCLLYVRKRISEGATVCVHCAAGIHRTGMFSYALLRLCGLSANAAQMALCLARKVTSDGIGFHRVEAAERLFRQIQRLA